MNETEQALTEAVAIQAYVYMQPHDWQFPSWEEIDDEGQDKFRRVATAAVAAVRAHDEQAALNCGHCTPNADEIACACKIEERDDE